jgi:diaminopropionate ammonia-lyase
VVIAGASGAAGLAGLLVALEDDTLRRALFMDPASRVLVINTEGATDPEMYRHQIAAPRDVRARAEPQRWVNALMARRAE